MTEDIKRYNKMQAVSFAKSILAKEQAINNAESDRVKREYRLSAHRDREELLYYCKQNGISLKDVFREAQGMRVR